MYQLNVQPKEAKDYYPEGSLEVVNIFPTIQGEGPDAGEPAVFIRLAGCNLDCPQCDTNYTEGRKRLSVDQIIQNVHTFGICSKNRRRKLVVISGGEPFRQNIGPLVVSLADNGYPINIETNGSFGIDHDQYSILDDVDVDLMHVIVSPKTKEIPLRMHNLAAAYKYVIDADSIDPVDGLPLKVLGKECRVARPTTRRNVQVFVQPADEQDEAKDTRNLEACLQICQAFGYRLSLQLHKILGVD